MVAVTSNADQMDGGAVGEVVETPPQRFAVEGDNPNAFTTDLVGQNGGVDAEDPFQLARIEALQDQPYRHVGRSPPPAQAQSHLQPVEVNVDEGMDAPVRVGAATTARMANSSTCGSVYIRPWARRGAGTVRRRSRKWLNVVMATPAG